MQNTTGELTLEEILGPGDDLAIHVVNLHREWQQGKDRWLAERREVLEYIFATDTSGTANRTLPWKNSTHIPKICQIRDNLHANYMAAMFSNDRPYQWEGGSQDDETLDKRKIIESYMHNKMRRSNYLQTVSQLVLDYIDYGNVFATVESVYETRTDPDTGDQVPGYIGPKVVRINPADIVFNPAATDFQSTAKIIRSLNSLGSIKNMIETRPEMRYLEEVYDKMVSTRTRFGGISESDYVKDASFDMMGFQSWHQYFTSGYVEILDFYGDVYDPRTQELQRNRAITVVDRQWVIRNVENPSWSTHAPIFHAGWRLRPDNLWAMGPLDNLLGMQYRIDHLENAKADGLDLIIHPVMKITGYVEEFDYGPGAKIHVGDEGDVNFMPPDTTMLTADTQIAMYENKMEEMAGAPRQAMGFRTPGEKTKYEVQVLENGANRVFVNKTAHFEQAFIEPLINAMLISARQNVQYADIIRVIDDDTGAVEFLNVTKEDLTATGKLYPIGSRHFQRDANTLQSLTALSGSPLMQDPSVKAHISGYAVAKLIEQLVGVDRFDIVQKNVGVVEAAETQQAMQAAQQVVGEQSAARQGPPVAAPQEQGTPPQ